jgi:hypothetical protein
LEGRPGAQFLERRVEKFGRPPLSVEALELTRFMKKGGTAKELFVLFPRMKGSFFVLSHFTHAGGL